MVGNTPTRNGSPAGHPPANSPAVLWALLKVQTRAVMLQREQNTILSDAATSLSTEVSDLHRETQRLLLDVTQWRADHARLRTERDEIARESAVREQEIISLTVERDRLEARLSALDSEGGVA